LPLHATNNVGRNTATDWSHFNGSQIEKSSTVINLSQGHALNELAGDKTLNEDHDKTEMILGTIIDIGENSDPENVETFEQKMDKMTAARKAYE